jgi:molybdenum cofactor cytidylyltransferase
MIPAVILAAGRSTRMGRLKATLPAGGGDTFLTRIIRTFRRADVEDVVAVIGHEAESVRASVAASGLMARLIVNADYERGQLSSVLTGLAAIDRPGVSAMLLMLVDAPFVSEETVRAVLRRYRETRAPIVRPVRGADHGHPVLIDRSLFDRLRAADPIAGIKPTVRANVSSAGDVAVDDDGAFLDIDTPEEYERAIARFMTPRERL